MISLSVDDCRLKVRYYRNQLAEAQDKVTYLRSPDITREQRIKKWINTHERLRKKLKNAEAQGLYNQLIQEANNALKQLPQHLSDDELTESIITAKERVKASQARLVEAVDELEAYIATPEFVDSLRADYEQLPRDVKGKPMVVSDDGVIVTDQLEIVTPEQRSA
jgi:predicted  nucleic acid-binding Zn-ribbon protein